MIVRFIIPIAVISAFLIYLFRNRKSYYPHNRHADYAYNMEQGVQYYLMLRNNELILPKSLNDDYTIFARVHLTSCLSGYFLHPSLAIISNKGIFRQYTEYGTKGYRYINLSNVCDADNRTVRFKGKRLRLRNEKIEITAFRNPTLDNKKILLIAPHPDDAEIAAYGLYEKYAENVFIVTVSPGENGFFRYKELFSKAERTAQHLKKGQLRMWNSLTVPLLAGVSPERLISFGYFNEVLETMYQFPEKEIPSKKFDTTDINIFRKQNFSRLAKMLRNGSNWPALVENLRIVINNFQPDIIITPYPYLDSHEDHQYSTIATIEALHKMNYQKGVFLFYTNHFHFYPYGRTGATMPLPPMFDYSVYFKSLFSFPLTFEQQRNKILAFDAMNDLRPNTDYRSWKRLLARGFTSLRANCFSLERDYFNLYIRSNELFYVVPVEEVFKDEIYNAVLHGKKS